MRLCDHSNHHCNYIKSINHKAHSASANLQTNRTAKTANTAKPAHYWYAIPINQPTNQKVHHSVLHRCQTNTACQA